MPDVKTAAFFRVEGTLLNRGALAASVWFTSKRGGFSGQRSAVAERAFRTAALAVSAPLHGLLARSDPSLAMRAAYLPLRDLAEERIAELAEEYVRTVLLDLVYDQGRKLIRTARKAGHRIVLVSEAIEQVARRLASELQVEECVCNRLGFENGRTTGKLLEPVVGGHDASIWVRGYATEHGLALSECEAYAARGADVLLLSAVGRPHAVNPDMALRAAARAEGWSILDY
jgi:phosphoserine phosphatase